MPSGPAVDSRLSGLQGPAMPKKRAAGGAGAAPKKAKAEDAKPIPILGLAAKQQDRFRTTSNQRNCQRRNGVSWNERPRQSDGRRRGIEGMALER